ncbi:hypothetical protein HKX48_005312 [Thoreauomyces humboldtii]|nr:hypothetical protein HKX48_005312 [Thoreauomyces humboldtii]
MHHSSPSPLALLAFALLAHSAAATLVIDKPGSTSSVAPGAAVPIFTSGTTTLTTFSSCLVKDSTTGATVGTCGGAALPSAAGVTSFTIADLTNGRPTALVPNAAGTYTVVIGDGTQTVTSTPFTVAAAATVVAATQSSPLLDPRGFGIILSVPASVGAGLKVPFLAATDARYSEATAFNDCSLVGPTNVTVAPCSVNGTLTIAALRSGSVSILPPATLRGTGYAVQLSVSSSGCAVDDGCFSDNVRSETFAIVAPVANDQASATAIPMSTDAVVASSVPAAASSTPVASSATPSAAASSVVVLPTPVSATPVVPVTSFVNAQPATSTVVQVVGGATAVAGKTTPSAAAGSTGVPGVIGAASGNLVGRSWAIVALAGCGLAFLSL